MRYKINKILNFKFTLISSKALIDSFSIIKNQDERKDFATQIKAKGKENVNFVNFLNAIKAYENNLIEKELKVI